MPLIKQLASFSLAFLLCQSIALAEPVVVVSSRSSISSLNHNQLADIFLGRVSQFPNGEPATPIDLAEGSEVRDEFYARYLSRSAAQMRAYWSKIIFTGKGQPPSEVPNVDRIKKKVAESTDHISYIDRSALDPNLKIVVVTRP